MSHTSAHPRIWQWRSNRLLPVCFLALLATGGVLQAQTAEGLRIVPLVRDDQVLVSFTLADGFTDEVRAAIQSGLKTTFTYTVDLRLDVPGWVDRTIGTATATSSVEYDTLERRYKVVRVIDGRTEESRVTEDESVVRQWLTVLQRLPLFRTSVLEPNREYLRPGQSDGSSKQRLHPLAVRQRYVSTGKIYVHPVSPPSVEPHAPALGQPTTPTV